jgi:hypothetical protein
MQGSPSLFTQHKKPMGFYVPPCPSKPEIARLIEVSEVPTRVEID